MNAQTSHTHATDRPAEEAPVERPVRPRAWVVLAQYPYATMDPPIEGGLPREELFTRAQLDAAVAAERERCAKLCEEMGALEALEGEDEGSAALVRVADRMADLCAAAIRKA